MLSRESSFPGAIALAVVATVSSNDARGSEEACEALVDAVEITVTRATWVSGGESDHCYIRGVVTPNIRYHIQLPAKGDWNGRLLHWGDGGKDGDLDFAPHRLAEGYAVVNSNTGHDIGAEPGASFGWNNRQAEIDFGYRAVHVTANAAKTAVGLFYGRPADFSYHEGCSTGGRQGLMAAQRFPGDFDGIVAGAPVNYYQEINMSHVWMLQRAFEDDFAGVPGFDTDGDGLIDNFDKLQLLHDRVTAACDAQDGIRDGVIDDPRSCDFDPQRDLADVMCEADGRTCFTPAQLELVVDFYRGAVDSDGTLILKGLPLGSELAWTRYFPSAANNGFPMSLLNASNHGAYLFFEEDPGLPIANPQDVKQSVGGGVLGEWAWWQFDIDNLTNGTADFMKAITNAADPDLQRFLLDGGGKLLLYHGWLDVGAHPEPTLDYYEEMVQSTFAGDMDEARQHARLFMFPGMAHCGGGHGPNEWDPLTPLVQWVEEGKAPDAVVAQHRTDGKVDNERLVCAHPQRTVYTGPSNSANRPANWRKGNFACE